MQYAELYELQGAIQFVSNFVSYEPLENVLHMPEFLPSPMSTLSFQAGDSFDIATLLTSLLCGVGYDAYMVVGYAPPDVVLNDQTKSTCPLLEAEQGAAAAAKAPEVADVKPQGPMCAEGLGGSGAGPDAVVGLKRGTAAAHALPVRLLGSPAPVPSAS